MYQLNDTGIICKDDTRSFSMKKIKDILARLSTRRERGNGDVSLLAFDLFASGSCTRRRSETSGIRCERVSVSPAKYSIVIYGELADEMLAKLNAPNEQELAIKASQERRRARRELYKQGLAVHRCRRRHRTIPTLKQTRHFKRSTITLAAAVTAIAYASRVSHALLESSMSGDYLSRGRALLSLSDGFLFVLRRQPEGLELHSTEDNRHPAYRRLRSKLRKLLKCERKSRSRRQQAFRAQAYHHHVLMRFAVSQ